MNHHPIRAAHFKAVVLGATNYACVQHEMRLRAQMATVEAVPPSERDAPGCWCTFCNLQGDITQLKGGNDGH